MSIVNPYVSYLFPWVGFFIASWIECLAQKSVWVFYGNASYLPDLIYGSDKRETLFTGYLLDQHF